VELVLFKRGQNGRVVLHVSAEAIIAMTTLVAVLHRILT